MKRALLSLVILCMTTIAAWAQGKVITGRVLDKAGEAVIGASVLEVGTTNGSLTDIEGRFKLTLRNTKSILTISSVGYQTQKIQLVGLDLTKPISVRLVDEARVTDEVVVTAYGGRQLRSKMTNSVATVRNETLKQGLFSNPAQALSGAVSGLRVQQTSGSPGAAPTLVLRGGTNLDGSGSPLVVIDGQVRSGLNDINPEDIESMEVMKDAGATAIYGARANNGVILITTKRGKAGFSEIRFKAKVSANYFHDLYEFLGAEDYIRMQRMAIKRSSEVFTNSRGQLVGYTNQSSLAGNVGYGTGRSYFDQDGVTPLDGNKDARATYGLYEYSDNLKFLLDQGWKTMTDPVTGKKLIYSEEGGLRQHNIKDVAMSQDYNLSFTGGNDRGNYYANIGYNHSNGNALVDWYKRINFALNADYKIRPWLTSNSSFAFTRADWNKLGNDDANYFGRALGLPPTLRLRNAQGQLLLGLGGGDINYKVVKDSYLRDNKTNKFSMSQAFTINFLKELTLKLSGNWYFSQAWNESFDRDRLKAPGQWYRSRYSYAGASETLDQTYNAVLNYNKTLFDKHNLSLMAGTEYYDSYYKGLSASGSEAKVDDFAALGYTSDEKGKRSTTTSHTHLRILSYFGRANYDYDGRYLLSLVARYDGYSKLVDNRWGFFPGLSAGWVLSRENFYNQLSGLKDVLNFAKLRVSYGSNGNVSGIGAYDLYGRYGLSKYGGNEAISLTSLPNYGLRWEKTNTFELGADLGFFNNRLTANLTYYNRITVDKFASMPITSHSGISGYSTNNGSLRNRGFEFDLTARIISTKDWTWNASLNGGFNKNTILKLPNNGLERNRQGAYEVYTGNGNEKKWVGGYQEGQSPGDIYAFQAEGLYRTEAEIPENLIDKVPGKNLYGPKAWANLDAATKDAIKALPIQPGDVRWRDVNGDGVIDQYDRVYIGRSTPLVTGGFNTQLTWRQLTLSARLDYALGHHVVDGRTPWILGNMQGTFNTLTIARDKTFSAENPNAKYSPYVWADQLGKSNFYRSSSQFIYRGDYLAFREISLSYRVPEFLTKKMAMNSLELSLTAQNLGYLTAAKLVYSPEPGADTMGGYSLPRTLVFGLNVGF